MIQAALYSRITTDPTITGLVGSRVYQGVAPQDQGSALLSRITFYRIAEDRERDLHGGVDLYRATFQIDCWAPTNTALESLRTAVRNRIDVGGPQLWGTVKIRSVAVTDESERDWQVVSDGQEELVHRTRFEAVLWYVRT